MPNRGSAEGDRGVAWLRLTARDPGATFKETDSTRLDSTRLDFDLECCYIATLSVYYQDLLSHGPVLLLCNYHNP
jgi:hypothetical protein